MIDNLTNFKSLKLIIDSSDNLKLLELQGPLQLPKRKFPVICKYCGREFTSGSPSGNNCNMCKIIFKCKSCNKSFELSKRYIDFNNLEELKNIKCTSCIKKETSNKRKQPGYCTKCGKYSESRNHYGYCIECSEVFQKENYKIFKQKTESGICVICHNFANSRDIIGRCKKCHIEWYNKHNNSEKMKDIRKNHFKELAINNQKPGKCRKCGEFVEKRSSAGLCSFCISNINKNNKLPGYCTKCGKYSEIRDTVGRCYNCRRENLKNWVNSEEFHNIQKENGIKTVAINKSSGYCIKCGEFTTERSSFGFCSQCQIKYGRGNFNFITKNNVRYYKGIEVETFAKKVLFGELDINNYPSINIRYGRVCYGAEDIITSEKLIKNNSNFEEKDDILYFYDRSVCDYVPWNDYKKKFINISNNMELNNNFNDLLQGFKFYPTFRSQDSINWENGSKSAFEQSLVDADIHWFTYIKFYIDYRTKNIKPLVVGKSGSLLVNGSGSDLSFSTDINDGPARRFLAETNNSSWDKTQVAILPCENEEKALEKENEIFNKYNLFLS